MSDVRILVGDVLERLGDLPDGSVHCVVTSPPYWGLRDYGVDGQLGLEPTIEEFIEKMTAVFEEVRRVLRDDGTLWLNMGDCYAGSWSGNSMRPKGGTQRPGGPGMQPLDNRYSARNGVVPEGLKAKDLVGQPWRLAFALQGISTVPGAALAQSADALATARETGDWHAVRGVEMALRAWARASAYLSPWWHRSDIIWHKPNPMPESCRDRPTKSHEYVFLMTKRPRYFFDQEAVREKASTAGQKHEGRSGGREGYPTKRGFKERVDTGKRNTRTVWKMATQPFGKAHFATFPEELPRRCIAAGTSEKGCCPACGAPVVRVVKKSGGTIGESWHDHGDNLGAGQSQAHEVLNSKERAATYKRETTGWELKCGCLHSRLTPCTVLDPFGGAGTTALVAAKMGRAAILTELNPEYAEMAKARIEDGCGLLANVRLEAPIHAAQE